MMPPTNPPRWFTALSKTLKEHEKSTTYSVASVGQNSQPHVRSQIHRGFLHPSSHPSLPLLLTSTDIRTPKVTQMLSNPLVEICFWIEPTQEQFRFSSRVTLVPAPENSLYEPATSTLAELAGGKFGEGEVDWEKKRLEMFDSMSGHMKASWVRPPPGSKMPGSGGYDEAKKWPERLPKRGEEKDEKEKREVEEALGNFGLMVIEPYEVDYVELGVVPNQRTRFVRVGDEWEEEILVP